MEKEIYVGSDWFFPAKYELKLYGKGVENFRNSSCWAGPEYYEDGDYYVRCACHPDYLKMVVSRAPMRALQPMKAEVSDMFPSFM